MEFSTKTLLRKFWRPHLIVRKMNFLSNDIQYSYMFDGYIKVKLFCILLPHYEGIISILIGQYSWFYNLAGSYMPWFSRRHFNEKKMMNIFLILSVNVTKLILILDIFHNSLKLYSSTHNLSSLKHSECLEIMRCYGDVVKSLVIAHMWSMLWSNIILFDEMRTSY